MSEKKIHQNNRSKWKIILHGPCLYSWQAVPSVHGTIPSSGLNNFTQLRRGQSYLARIQYAVHLVGEHLLVFKPTKKERKNGIEGKLSVNRVRMPELFVAFFSFFFLASVKSSLCVGSTEGDGSLMDRTSFPQGPCFFSKKHFLQKGPSAYCIAHKIFLFSYY